MIRVEHRIMFHKTTDQTVTSTWSNGRGSPTMTSSLLTFRLMCRKYQTKQMTPVRRNHPCTPEGTSFDETPSNLYLVITIETTRRYPYDVNSPTLFHNFFLEQGRVHLRCGLKECGKEKSWAHLYVFVASTTRTNLESLREVANLHSRTQIITLHFWWRGNSGTTSAASNYPQGLILRTT